MAENRQRGILTLLKHVSKPLQPHNLLRSTDKTSLVPAPKETIQILQNLNLRSLGIGLTKRGRPCSFFEWKRLKEATDLAKLLTNQSSYEDFARMSAVVHDVVNEEIFVYAVMYAVLHNPALKGLQLPPIEEVLPYWFFPSTVLANTDYRVKDAKSEKERIVVEYEFSHTELDPEYRMAYFREDIGVNSHHWHWHLAYPYTWTPELGGNRDRKGELFYYMHEQVMARYDTDRLCNGLTRVRPLRYFHGIFDLAYFPNLTATTSGIQYSPRPANLIPSDTLDTTLRTLSFWENRIMDAIHQRSVIDPKGSRTPLVDPKGIDMLGAIVEASAISINQPYYGELHNKLHLLVGRVHDPFGKYGSENGVMSYTATAMRDPIFYQLHRLVDNIFEEYKQTLPPYTKQELEWPDVEVNSISVLGELTQKPNFLQTFWQKREVLVSHGLDFQKSNPVFVKIPYLNHEEFVYKIEVNNRTENELQAILRIFLAPISNEMSNPFELTDQRRFFIELDKYKVTLKPGMQALERNSEDSNVTLPPGKGFGQLEKLVPTEEQAFCGCGWPQHLLLPKGSVEGISFVLFAMVTNWELDKVENLPEKTCSDASSYCGIRDQKYPDKRNMGFPFDRPVPLGADLKTFLTPNMTTQKIIIRHAGNTVEEN